MRLHRLTVTAFGPFPGTETVDFDALTRGGLFLLHGPTGAGKTSVLDAVCFALYGSVPGARQGKRLRSDHAMWGTLTEVVLDLTIGGRRLEITRRPQQEAPKGEGTQSRTVRSKTTLREWRTEPDPGWVGRSVSHQEVGEEVRQLLGMNREQFCQVVLLPQGDFARFLRADATQRATLLGELFDTRRFAAVEGWLAERRRATAEEARTAVDEVLRTVHRLHQAADSSGEAPAGDETGWAGLVDAALEFAAPLRVDAWERHTHTRVALAAAERRHAAAERLRAYAQSLAERQARYAKASARSTELDLLAAEHQHITELLESSRRAALVAPLLRLAGRRGDEHAAAAEAERQTRLSLAPTLAIMGERELEQAEAELRQCLARLSELAADQRGYEEKAAELAKLREELAVAEEVHDDASRWLEDDWPPLRERAMAQVRDVTEAAYRADQLADQLAQAVRRREAAVEAEALGPRLDAARAAEREARDRAAQAHEEWNVLREHRIQGMAAELAAHLTEGTPCPVCGSPDHPRPATPAPDRVTSDDEAKAERTYRALRSARQSAAERVSQLSAQVAAASATTEGLAVDKLTTMVEQLTEEQAMAWATAASAAEARHRVERLEAEHAHHVTAKQRAGELIAAHTARLETLVEERRRGVERLEAALGDDVDLAERTARLTADLERYTRARSAASASREAAAHYAQAKDEVEDAARRAGFASATEAAEALLDEERQRALRHRLDRYREERAAVGAVLEDPETSAAAAEPAADPHAAQQALAQAVEALRSATAREHTARERVAALEKLSRTLAAQAIRIGPLIETHTLTTRLAGLAAGTSGDNILRMRLESYVLAARLEQVAAAASARLERMSAGRYTLVHSDERAAGNRRSGLGLQVVDAWTGRARDTATLSGGESFLASLALALGLADVVTFEAGGGGLDTLFIDEGFGSLDAQALDDVLDVLDALRERDRAVGIVSHVPELRQRIPTQLRVIRGRHGSSMRTTGAEKHGRAPVERDSP